jgi:hypothetical protein
MVYCPNSPDTNPAPPVKGKERRNISSDAGLTTPAGTSPDCNRLAIAVDGADV